LPSTRSSVDLPTPFLQVCSSQRRKIKNVGIEMPLLQCKRPAA
jgi:hypothetical protein